MNKSIVDDIYSRHYGSEKFYYRNYYKKLIYTEGIMDFQQTLSAYWLIDSVISQMPKVIDTSIKEDDGFFVVSLNKCKNEWELEIYREGYVNNVYSSHIIVSCYDTITKYKNRKQAISFYISAIASSEGSEQNRYSNIISQLYSGNMYCSDTI